MFYAGASEKRFLHADFIFKTFTESLHSANVLVHVDLQEVMCHNNICLKAQPPIPLKSLKCPDFIAQFIVEQWWKTDSDPDTV